MYFSKSILPAGNSITLEFLNAETVFKTPKLKEVLLEALKTCLKNRQFTNYGSYIPLASVMPPFMLAYPDKLTTLSHKHAVLRPG